MIFSEIFHRKNISMRAYFSFLPYTVPLSAVDYRSLIGIANTGVVHIVAVAQIIYRRFSRSEHNRLSLHTSVITTARSHITTALLRKIKATHCIIQTEAWIFH